MSALSIRLGVITGILVAGAGVAMLVADARPAIACSRARFSAYAVPETVAESPVVAIGTFTEASARSATFRVDEPLKGPAAGSTLKIDNRLSYTYFACSPYDEPFDKGHRFSEGDQRIVMLSKEVDGLWQVSYFSDTAWTIPDDELQPLITDFWNDGSRPPTLDSVKAQIAANKAKLGSDLGWEFRTPCNAVNDLGIKVASSTAIVIGDVEPSDEGARVLVLEVLAGSPPTTFTVNTHARRDYNTCEVVQDQFSPRQSGRWLMYLRPDEAGIADYRLAFWGGARDAVNDRYVTWELPTLRDIRDAVGEPQVTSVAPANDDGGATWPYVVAAIGFAGLVLGAVLWRRGATRSPR